VALLELKRNNVVLGDSLKKQQICFVCTANICRGPFAEFYLKKRLEEQSLAGVTVESAGIRATDGLAAPDFLVEIAKDFDVDLATHKSKTLSPDISQNSTLLLGMEKFHCSEVELLHPMTAGKNFLLRNFAAAGSKTRDIKDPFGLSNDFIESCYDDIAEAIDGLILFLKKEQP
jgi:protein-tyrosine phosphatase